MPKFSASYIPAEGDDTRGVTVEELAAIIKDDHVAILEDDDDHLNLFTVSGKRYVLFFGT